MSFVIDLVSADEPARVTSRAPIRVVVDLVSSDDDEAMIDNDEVSVVDLMSSDDEAEDTSMAIEDTSMAIEDTSMAIKDTSMAIKDIPIAEQAKEAAPAVPSPASSASPASPASLHIDCRSVMILMPELTREQIMMRDKYMRARQALRPNQMHQYSIPSPCSVDAPMSPIMRCQGKGPTKGKGSPTKARGSPTKAKSSLTKAKESGNFWIEKNRRVTNYLAQEAMAAGGTLEERKLHVYNICAEAMRRYSASPMKWTASQRHSNADNKCTLSSRRHIRQRILDSMRHYVTPMAAHIASSPEEAAAPKIDVATTCAPQESLLALPQESSPTHVSATNPDLDLARLLGDLPELDVEEAATEDAVMNEPETADDPPVSEPVWEQEDPVQEEEDPVQEEEEPVYTAAPVGPEAIAACVSEMEVDAQRYLDMKRDCETEILRIATVRAACPDPDPEMNFAEWAAEMQELFPDDYADVLPPPTDAEIVDMLRRHMHNKQWWQPELPMTVCQLN